MSSEKITPFILLCFLFFYSFVGTPAEAKRINHHKHSRSTIRQPNDDEKKARVVFILNNHEETIRRESVTHDISIPILTGVISQESSGNTRALSTDGKKSRGLTQTRSTADKATGIKCDSFESSCSIKKGAAYLSHLRNVENLNTDEKMILGYNRGPSGARKYKGNPGLNYYVVQVKSYAEIAENILTHTAKKVSEKKSVPVSKVTENPVPLDEKNQEINVDLTVYAEIDPDK